MVELIAGLVFGTFGWFMARFVGLNWKNAGFRGVFSRYLWIVSAGFFAKAYIAFYFLLFGVEGLTAPTPFSPEVVVPLILGGLTAFALARLYFLKNQKQVN